MKVGHMPVLNFKKKNTYEYVHSDNTCRKYTENTNYDLIKQASHYTIFVMYVMHQIRYDRNEMARNCVI